MSRIGTQPVIIPQEVEVEINGRRFRVKGPKGELEKVMPMELELTRTDGSILIKKKSNNKRSKSLHGTFRALISNMVKGVTEGWEKELELVGTGYRAEVKDDRLILTVGYSHPVEVRAVGGINFKVEKTKITVSGIDKEKVGHIAAVVRAVRPPEPYKGKGIKYLDEVVRRKAGKAAKAAGAM